MRYCLHLSYLGTHFRGWQRQPNVLSVQEVIEINLSKILKTTIGIIGCGRTDAGVHASDYYAHFKYPGPLPELFLHKMNFTLPRTIAIHSCQAVDTSWHARFSAVARSYTYHCHTIKDPFRDYTSTLLPYGWDALDQEAMQAAVALFTQYNDFRAFCKVPDKHNHTRCNITRAVLSFNEAQQTIRLDIRSNRFLQGMIRLIMSHLLNVGLGKLTPQDIERFLTTGERSNFFRLAPPQGLFLCKIEYPVIPFLPQE